jgi:acyl-coenzyme A thioesterase PaaI-like protein
MGRFLEYDRGRSVATKKFNPKHHHPRVSLHGFAKGFWGE